MLYRNINNLLSNHSFYIFGASSASDEVEQFLISSNKKILGYVDNDPLKVGKQFHNLDVLSPLEVKKIVGDGVAIVIASAYQNEIACQLIDELLIPLELVFPYVSSMFSGHFGVAAGGMDDIRYQKLINRLADDESREYLKSLIQFRESMDARRLIKNPLIKGFYNYDENSLGPHKDNLIVDVGAFTGDTAKAYLDRLNNHATIVALEPLPINYSRLVRFVLENGYASQIIPLQIAAGESRGEAVLAGDCVENDPRATLKEHKVDECHSIKVEKIDDLFRNTTKAINFIKVDVEGFEPSVIEGARETLRKYTPGLAIAAYHTPEHVWSLIELLDEIIPGYVIYLGHHPSAVFECEIYAFHKNYQS